MANQRILKYQCQTIFIHQIVSDFIKSMIYVTVIDQSILHNFLVNFHTFEIDLGVLGGRDE